MADTKESKKISGMKQKIQSKEIKFDQKAIVSKHLQKETCTYQEAKFILSKIKSFSIP